MIPHSTPLRCVTLRHSKNKTPASLLSKLSLLALLLQFASKKHSHVVYVVQWITLFFFARHGVINLLNENKLLFLRTHALLIQIYVDAGDLWNAHNCSLHSTQLQD